MKRKKRIIALLLLLALPAAGLLGAKPLYHLYRELEYRWGDPSEAARRVYTYAQEQDIPYGTYPKDLIELLETNPETEEFVLWYPFREETEVDLSGYVGDGVPLFLQWDPMWGYEDYGSSCIAVTGCGPTCLAMVGYYLTGDPNMTPDRVAEFAEKNGYYASGYGSSWTLISQGSAELGLSAKELPLVKKKITDALGSGSPVILAMGKGDFTTTGHYIVLTGVVDGQFTVNDPNSRVRSGQLWSYEQLEGQIRNIWAISKA